MIIRFHFSKILLDVKFLNGLAKLHNSYCFPCFVFHFHSIAQPTFTVDLIWLNFFLPFPVHSSEEWCQ